MATRLPSKAKTGTRLPIKKTTTRLPTKALATKGAATKIKTSIQSPYAKFDSAGQLHCMLCRMTVKSEASWTIHLRGKTHKENIEKKKNQKQ
eukprot:Pgem_evm1s17616